MDRTRTGRIRRVLRAAGAAVLAATLSGCWLQLGAGSANTRTNSNESELTRDNVDTLAVDWRVPIDSFLTEPIVSGGMVYVTNRIDAEGEGSILAVLGVSAYDRDTGDLVWEHSLLPADGTPVSGMVETPALEDGALWVPYWHSGLDGGCGGRIERLDPATGAVLSSDATGTGPSALVMSGSDVIYMNGTCAGTGAAQLVVRDRDTRDVRWSHTFPSFATVTIPTVGGGRIFVNRRGTLSAFTAAGCGANTCAPEWTQTVGQGFFDFLRPALASGGNLVMIGHPTPGAPESVVVRDAATGAIRWSGPTDRYNGSLPGRITGIAVDGDTVFVAGARTGAGTSGNEAILDAYPVAGCGGGAGQTCQPTWTTSFGATRPAREPTVAGGVVYVSLVPGISTAPSIAAVDADGCGAASCPVLKRVPFVAGSGPFLESAQPYVTSVAAGGVFVGWLPDLYGPTASQLIALSPTG